MWAPELAPGALLFQPAPCGFNITLPIDPATVASALVDRTDGMARELLIADEAGAVQVRLEDAETARRPAVLLPLDNLVDLRLDVALRFIRRLRGERVNLLPAALRLTPLQRSRLIQLLHAFDIHDAGGGPRDVASEVLASDQAQLPSVEWKDSHARRKANRLIHDSIALVERGYLKLLRGG